MEPRNDDRGRKSKIRVIVNEDLKNQKISITKKAATRLKNIIENEETDSKGIRVTIDTGGCSGMSYKITLSLIHI